MSPSRIHLATTAALTAALALAGLAPRPAAACSVCACGDPLLAASEAPAMAGALRLSLDGEWLQVESASEETPGDTNRLTQQTLRLSAVYSPLDRLNLVLGVPMTSKGMKSLVGGETLSDETGLGDLEVGARWFLFTSADVGARRAQSFGLSAGTSLPTGRRVTGLDEHGQPGTGAWGPYAGLLYRIGQGDFAAVASVTGRVRTENGDGYRYGNALLWSVQGEWDASKRVGVALALDGRQAGVDRDDLGRVENTGGLVMALAPAVSVGLSGGLFVTARAQIPVVKRLEGEQDVGPTFNVGLQWQVF